MLECICDDIRIRIDEYLKFRVFLLLATSYIDRIKESATDKNFLCYNELEFLKTEESLIVIRYYLALRGTENGVS